MNGITDRPGYPGRSVRTRGSAFRSVGARRGLRIVAATLVAAFLLTGCDAKPTAPTIALPAVPAGVRGVVVDTDMGLDDALALLYLGSRDDVAIRAVTVEGDGLVHCRAGVRNARELLTLTGHPDVPVACGGERPLQGSNAFPDEWRSTADDLYGLELPAPVGQATDRSVTGLLSAALDGTTDLLTLGPYTNVAAALREDPALAGRVPAVVSMAGAVDVPGNAPGGVAEYNVWVDPLAAKEVLAALPVTLVPLDATNAVPITPFFVDSLGRHLGTPAARAVHDLIADDPFLVSGQYFFWDPLAAGLLTEPGLGTYVDRTLLVTASLDAGAGWINDYDRGAPVRVTTRADALGFEEAFLSALAGEPVIDVRPDPDIVVEFDGDTCRMTASGGVTAGAPIALVFRNGSAADAIAVLAGFGGTTTYQDLLDFVGAPGSPVTGAPKGFRPVGSISAAGGQDGWLALTLERPNVAIACGTQPGETFLAWPGGWLPVDAAGTSG